MASGPFTQAERDELRRLHGEGWTLGAIAHHLGRARSTVSNHAAAMDLAWDRAQTATATHAVVIDAKARRAALAVDLLSDAQRLRERLWDPFVLHSFGGADHVHRQVTLEMPAPKDQRDLMGAVTQAVTSSLRLDEHDADAGAADAVSMVSQLFAGLRATRPPDEDEEVGA